MPAIALIIGLLVGVAMGVIGTVVVRQRVLTDRLAAAERDAEQIRSEADRRQKEHTTRSQGRGYPYQAAG